mmetsp:Transcript_13455/g.32923  ORF Transcript_13455/g.32923 Transcript_13455/m.32923 type:complete len:248 (+) Transcript_13455:3491-4234(+)
MDPPQPALDPWQLHLGWARARGWASACRLAALAACGGAPHPCGEVAAAACPWGACPWPQLQASCLGGWPPSPPRALPSSACTAAAAASWPGDAAAAAAAACRPGCHRAAHPGPSCPGARPAAAAPAAPAAGRAAPCTWQLAGSRAAACVAWAWACHAYQARQAPCACQVVPWHQVASAGGLARPAAAAPAAVPGQLLRYCPDVAPGGWGRVLCLQQQQAVHPGRWLPGSWRWCRLVLARRRAQTAWR